MRSFLVALLGACLFVACGDGTGSQAIDWPTPPPSGGGTGGQSGGGGSGSGGGGGGGVPSMPAVVFDEHAIDLGRAGAFPSDLVVSDDGMLYTVDDAQVPFDVVGFRTDGTPGPARRVTIGASHLIDMDGTSPARTPTTWGSGLFGAFAGDLELVGDRWLFVTVGAGNSVSDDGGVPARPLWLANVVLVDLLTERVVQTVNLGWVLENSGTLSTGGGYTHVPQSLPVHALFVPGAAGTRAGKLYVAMSNGAGSSSGLQAFYQGTVQVWNVDFTRTEPMWIDASGKASRDVTRTYVSPRYNPVAFTRVKSDTGVTYLLLTSAGASLLDANWVAHPTTHAWIEFLDLDTLRWRPEWDVDLGPSLPAVCPLAVARDGAGGRFGLFSSQTLAACWIVDLAGLDSNPVDPSHLRVVRTVELVPGGAHTAGSGYQPGVALSASGRTAVVSSFTTSSLTVLGLPDDPAAGPVVVDPAPFDSANLATTRLSGIGAVAFSPSGVADVYALVNGTFDASFLPENPAYVATLTVRDGMP